MWPTLIVAVANVLVLSCCSLQPDKAVSDCLMLHSWGEQPEEEGLHLRLALKTLSSQPPKTGVRYSHRALRFVTNPNSETALNQFRPR